MGAVASLIREAARAKGIDVGLPEEFRHNGNLRHWFLDIPVGDLTCRILIWPPDAHRRTSHV
jgi:hypothetical protein